MVIDLNPENEDATQNIAAFYISNDKKSSEFEQFYEKLIDECAWSALPWNDPKVSTLKQAYNLDSVPTVIVLDKNLNKIDVDAVDDLVNLEPTLCRHVWCQALQQRLQANGEIDQA